jgi:hypothetical protein
MVTPTRAPAGLAPWFFVLPPLHGRDGVTVPIAAAIRCLPANPSQFCSKLKEDSRVQAFAELRDTTVRHDQRAI